MGASGVRGLQDVGSLVIVLDRDKLCEEDFLYTFCSLLFFLFQ